MSRSVLIVKDGQQLIVDSAAVIAHLEVGWSLDVNWDLNNFPQTDDLRFPAAGINPPGAASDPTRDTTDGRLVFSATAENIVALQAQAPHGMALDTLWNPHAHWSPTTTSTGNVKLQMKYKMANAITEPFPAEWTTLTTVQAASGIVDMHQLAAFPAIDMTGKNLSCMMLILFSRLGNDPEDTFTGEFKLNEFDIHVKLDSLGSNSEYVK